MNEQIYIVGDIHGCYKTLLSLLEQLPKDAKICFVGDLCDRGKDSKSVIEFIKSNNYDCILGNHEMMFIEEVERILKNEEPDPERSYWLNRCGGTETINSYYNENNELDRTLLKEHIEYLKSLPHYIEYKELKTEDNRYLVVSHSHVETKWQYRNNHKDSDEYKSFIKSISLSRYKNFDNKDIFNIFGHTPIEKIDLENKYKINIDTGCVYDNKEKNMKGYLSAIGFPNLKVIKQENVE